MIDQALESADDVLEHRRPGQLPDRRTNGPLDQGPVERFTLFRSSGQEGCAFSSEDEASGKLSKATLGAIFHDRAFPIAGSYLPTWLSRGVHVSDNDLPDIPSFEELGLTPEEVAELEKELAEWGKELYVEPGN